jgi:hypothetical protein
MINFKLKELDKIEPVGREGDLKTSWFWLTDADLWLDFGDNILYEYSKKAMLYFGDKPTPYNDYPLVRFIEDFTFLFKQINESVPDTIYNLTADLPNFLKYAEKWLAIYDTDENEYSDFYFEEYENLIRWIYDRSFDSGHIQGGPHIYFFRNNENLRISWETEDTIADGIDLWTAKDGSLEIDFSEFIKQVKTFGKAFFSQMNEQVNLAVQKDWGNIQLDKNRLIEEHNERESEFYSQLSLLEGIENIKTDWRKIEKLIKRMDDELKTKA